MIVNTILWSRLHISFFSFDYLTNYYIPDIITDTVSWSCYIALHIMFASRSLHACIQLELTWLCLYVIESDRKTYIDWWIKIIYQLILWSWYYKKLIEKIDHYSLGNYSRIFYWIMDIWSWPIYYDLWITWHHLHYFAFIPWYCHRLHCLVILIHTVFTI